MIRDRLLGSAKATGFDALTAIAAKYRRWRISQQQRKKKGGPVMKTDPHRRISTLLAPLVVTALLCWASGCGGSGASLEPGQYVREYMEGKEGVAIGMTIKLDFRDDGTVSQETLMARLNANGKNVGNSQSLMKVDGTYQVGKDKVNLKFKNKTSMELIIVSDQTLKKESGEEFLRSAP